MHIFIFRRDLRVYDNLAWMRLVEQAQGEMILPIFIFNDAQVNPQKNKYYSKNAVEFMVQCLKSLNEELGGKLSMFHTDTSDIDVLEKLGTIKTIAFNIDFTPFAIKRDDAIIKWCQERNIHVITTEDYTLIPINTTLTNSNTYFSVYTPFYRKFLGTTASNVPQPTSAKKVPKLSSQVGIAETVSIKDIDRYYSNKPNPDLFVAGGRANALAILKKIKRGDFEAYDKERDLPSLDKTTKLSAYLKFGCISIREAFHTIAETYGLDHGLIRELIWREFYANITYNKPRILQGQLSSRKPNLPFKEKYDKQKWTMTAQQKTWFTRWCDGNTGFPIVDAAMRQLNTTGWMHNRCRMIVASFLIKDMLVDWRLGEEYFAKMLVDYDPSSNNGGWQFCSSTGVDAQPYFRIFNPFSQSSKFDPDAAYIKRWVPELKDVDARDIHKWDTVAQPPQATSYPPPMLVHKDQAKKALEFYKIIK